MVTSKKIFRCAELATAARAVAARESDERVRNPDHMAGDFIGWRWRMLASPPLRSITKALYNRMAPGMYWYVTVRSKHFDEVVQTELDAGARQLVILGSGNDTRAWRFADRLAGCRIFELDLPEAIALKRNHLKKVAPGLPPNVRLIGADLNSVDLEQCLLAEGYDPSARTAFIMEGLTMYLLEDVVRRLLRFAATKSGPGSAVAFDCFSHRALHGDTQGLTGVDNALSYARRQFDTKLFFGLDKEQVPAFLSEPGLSLVSDLSHEDLAARYIVGSDGKRRGPVAPFLHIVWARTARPGDPRSS